MKLLTRLIDPSGCIGQKDMQQADPPCRSVDILPSPRAAVLYKAQNGFGCAHEHFNHRSTYIRSSMSPYRLMDSFLMQALLVLPSFVSSTPFVKRDVLAIPEPCTGDCSGYVHDPSVVYNGQGTVC